MTNGLTGGHHSRALPRLPRGAGPVIRNLIVHCYPRRSGMWRRTLRHLEAAWDQFTGRKIVTIAHDECCSDPDEVASEWPADCEIIIKPNVPGLQEVASFVPMLERVESREPDEYTTYVHCKGSTQNPDKAGTHAGHASHLWCDGMAAANLEYPQLVECLFASGNNIVGAFRSHGLWSFPGYHNWHYAGTWFTFRHSRAFDLDWRNVHQNFMGVEAWPGIFPVGESGCLFMDSANTAHLYSNDYWRDNITPSLTYWRASLAKCGLYPDMRGMAACRVISEINPSHIDGTDPPTAK